MIQNQSRLPKRHDTHSRAPWRRTARLSWASSHRKRLNLCFWKGVERFSYETKYDEKQNISRSHAFMEKGRVGGCVVDCVLVVLVWSGESDQEWLVFILSFSLKRGGRASPFTFHSCLKYLHTPSHSCFRAVFFALCFRHQQLGDAVCFFVSI